MDANVNMSDGADNHVTVDCQSKGNNLTDDIKHVKSNVLCNVKNVIPECETSNDLVLNNSESDVMNGTHSLEVTNEPSAFNNIESDAESKVTKNDVTSESKNYPENGLDDHLNNMAIQDENLSSHTNDVELEYNQHSLQAQSEINTKNNDLNNQCSENQDEFYGNGDSMKVNADSAKVKHQSQNQGKINSKTNPQTVTCQAAADIVEDVAELTSANDIENPSVETKEKLNQDMKDLIHVNLEKFSPKKEPKPINEPPSQEAKTHSVKVTDRPRRVNPFNHNSENAGDTGIWQMQQQSMPPSSSSLQALSTYKHEPSPSFGHHYSASEHNFKSNHLFNRQIQSNYEYPYATDDHTQFDLMPPSSRVLPSAESSTYFEDVDTVVREAKSKNGHKHHKESIPDPWVKMDQCENDAAATPPNDTNSIDSDYNQAEAALPSSSFSREKKEKEVSQPPATMIRPLIEAAGPCDPEDLIEGIIFTAHYLGSTQLQSERNPGKNARMMQAQEAVSRIKAPEGESQPSVEVDLFISTDKVKILNADTQETIMDHTLRSISYIADIGKLLVIMAKRRAPQSDNEEEQQIVRDPKPQRSYRLICHVFSSLDAHLMAQAIGQAFNVAYQQFLTANGIEPQTLTRDDYNQLLDMQEMYHDDLVHYSKRENVKDIWVEKNKGEPLGVVIVESGWGSIVPTVILANLQHGGPAERCGKLSIGDQIMTVNGTSLVGLPLATCQSIIKGLRAQSIARLNIVSCPPVVTVLIKRPDLKYQLGFSVQDGIICSLMRGGIAERGGVRVGHRIIEINNQSVVATPHEKIVQTLVSSVGEIQMKTMPAMMYRLLTGQEQPVYI